MKYLLILFLLTSPASLGCYYPVKHNSFVIRVTENDKILLDQKESSLLDLSQQLYEYYSINASKHTSSIDAKYQTISVNECQYKLDSLEDFGEKLGCFGGNDTWFRNEIKLWQRKLYILNTLSKNEYRFPSRETYIQIGVKQKTSYNMYIQVLSTIKETVGKLRNEKAIALFNISYDSILSKQNQPKMRTYKYITDVLVPEWIFDLPVRN